MQINQNISPSNEEIALTMLLCWFIEDLADCRDESCVFHILSHMNE